MTKVGSFLFISVLVSLVTLSQVSAYQVGNNPFRRAEVLDLDGKYLLEWEVDWTRKRVTFNVTVETKNWVGFGLSNDGISSGADTVVGGVWGNGRYYFSDRYTVPGSELSILDKSQDWALHFAWESGTHTYLLFSRALETCDSKDYPISINHISLVWAYGRNDNEEGLHPEKHGVYSVHLLDPEYSPQIIRDRRSEPTLVTSNSNRDIPPDTKVWSIHRSVPLPKNDTAYICSFHKVPRLKLKHHYIGFDIHFQNEESRLRSHHMMFFKCHAPPGLKDRELFESHLSNPGEACYVIRDPSPNLQFPIQFCSEVYMEWDIGAKSFFMPNHIGMPFGESPDQYFMLEVHYDNPDKQLGTQVDIRFDFFYTSQLRPHDGGMSGLIHEIPGQPESFMIPKNTKDHRMFAHCGSECTKRMYPGPGITIAAVALHSHNAGTRIRLRQFRNGRELPWILYDDNYDNMDQPFRHLRNEVKVLPGDELTIECHFQTNETTVLGGYSTRQEMCSAVFLYYNLIKGYGYCISGITSEVDRERFLGVRNISWVQDELDWIVQTPKRFAGLKVREVSDRFVDWTPKKRQELQRFHEVHPHTGQCLKLVHTKSLEELAANPPGPVAVLPQGPLATPEEFIGPISYPFQATPYIPPDSECRYRRG